MVNEINFWIETQIYEQYLSIKKGFSGVYKNGNKIQAKCDSESKQSKCYDVRLVLTVDWLLIVEN